MVEHQLVLAAALAWFLEIAFVQKASVCVCSRMCACPQAMENYLHETKPE